MRYIEPAYAKINLYLDVKDKRPDGYHEIESVMQQVSLCDTVSITKNDYTGENRITVTCTDETIPTDRRNIVWKCAEAFFDAFSITEYDLSIHIVKRIPSAAGLAGGSSDGAAVLKLLNAAYDIHAPIDKLCEIGGKIGADIPFCLIGKTCICRGIGEILSPVEMPFQPFGVLIVFPGNGISTPEAYRRLDACEPDKHIHTISDVLLPMQSGMTPLNLYNAFERAVFPVHEGAAYLRNRLLDLGAVTSLMSGSGPSVFGLFEDREKFIEAAELLEHEGYTVHPCNPVV